MVNSNRTMFMLGLLFPLALALALPAFASAAVAEKKDFPAVSRAIQATENAMKALDAAKALGAAAETFGGVDALINIAGGFRWETLADSTESAMRFPRHGMSPASLRASARSR